jgi:hypothetical protein
MRNEIYEIGDHDVVDTQHRCVPGGGATKVRQQSIKEALPAASNSDDHLSGVTQKKRVVRSGEATIPKKQPRSRVSLTALFSDDPAHGGTHSEPVVRRGGKTKGRLKPNDRMSPAASLPDDQVRPETQTERVVRGGKVISARLQPSRAVSLAAIHSDDRCECATQSEPVVSRGRGQMPGVTHNPSASSSKNRRGRLAAPAGEADQHCRDTHPGAVGFPNHYPIPGDHDLFETHRPRVAGGEASHAIADTQSAGAGLSISSPGDHSPPETHGMDVAGGEASQCCHDHHEISAGLSTSLPPDDQSSPATQGKAVVGGGEASHYASDIQIANAGLSFIIEEIREQWRRRQVWHRAEKSLTLQAKATCRRLVEGDKIKANALFKAAYTQCDNEIAEVAFAATFPLVEAGKSVELHRKTVEKRLLKLAAQLPIADFILGLRGVGLLSLAGIIGEAGDLSVYNGPAKLWKRMGVGIVDGGRQRRLLDKEAALRHGYSPSRRSHMWNIGSCIIKAGGPLKDLYVERKEYELAKPETASKLHAHRKAQRYVEKRLLREMWCEWRKIGR